MSTTPDPRRSTVAVVGAIALTVTAWASAFVAIRAVRHDIDPPALALGRLLIGSVALSIWVAARRAWIRPSTRDWGLIAVCGVAWFAIYNLALNTAEQHLDAGTAAMLVNVGPILIALLAGVLLREGFPRWLLIGAGIAFCGAILIGTATARGSHPDVLGIVLCLVAAASWAIGVTAQKSVLRRVPALQVTQLGCLIGALCLLPFAGHLRSAIADASAGSLAGLLYLGLVPTTLAFATWAYALSRMDAGRLGITTYLVPTITILLSWPLLGETPPALALAGGALALVGIAVSRRRSA